MVLSFKCNLFSTSVLHTVLFVFYVVLTLSLWMKSYDVTIQMKPLQQYFHMVLFALYVVLTLESVDEIL